MRNAVFISLLVILAVLLAACGGTATPAEGSGKPVNIQLESNPSPAMMGETELIFTVTDESGAPIQGAGVDVVADHTDMTGMTMNGAATDQGNGKYSIKADFSMSGTWKLTVMVRKDALDYQEDIEFKVQ